MIPNNLETTIESSFTFDLYDVDFNSMNLNVALYEWKYTYDTPSKVDTVNTSRTKYFEKDFEFNWTGSSKLQAFQIFITTYFILLILLLLRLQYTCQICGKFEKPYFFIARF